MMKPAKGFYAKLYLFWVLWVSSRSLISAVLISTLLTFCIYAAKGFSALNEATLLALKDIALFSFPFSFSLSFIIALLLVFKTLFSRKIDRYMLELYNCENEKIEKPALSDITALWRKWLFVTIWIILLFLVLFLGLFKLFFGLFPALFWFNGWTLYLLVISLGGSVFVYVVARCKKIKYVHV